ncbi:alpha/beta superfamily hydrolase (macronuclear) [Tetrahymena thermophila SB210]|uniref:Alpha/beta superfamily hydrolase n=1 Tax=Tetrahymena thermophila (strain SB210) TaxID=312017 RepID=W7XHU8_TETTS|nr:alpha/beta superfamily hydrolase [Tetrahymena thermophila SB210]EWS74061.1 alpha/beta superfamily hydrolase [Tetrahymena thermophila SB210]|eukprot:XP_012653394.1 alpha/beta superfamily hydrolase [Tetrahymena thermophila SB210]
MDKQLVVNQEFNQVEESKEDSQLIPQSASYVHGLESGFNGSKHRYLQNSFQKCYYVSMNMSLWNIQKKNSLLRNLCTNFFRPSRAAEESLKGCLKIQEDELKVNKPDIILGSSWGGGIGLLMVSEGIWDGPIVLCCPALKYLLDKVGQTPKYKWNEIVDRINQKNLGKNIVIIHGTKDKTIPYQNSVDCSKQIKDCQLITIENGDHKLNDYIIKNDRLKGIMYDLYKKYKLEQLNK